MQRLCTVPSWTPPSPHEAKSIIYIPSSPSYCCARNRMIALGGDLAGWLARNLPRRAPARARANSSPSVVGRHWTPVSLRSLARSKAPKPQNRSTICRCRHHLDRRVRKCVSAPAPGRASHMRHLYGMDMLCPGKARIARRRRGRGISSHPCARARGRTDSRTHGRTDGLME